MSDETDDTGRIRLSDDDRQKLAELAGVDAASANAELDCLEILLNDHRFDAEVLQHPKPNEVRDIIAPRRGAGLKKKAEALAAALRDVPWPLAVDFSNSGFDLDALRKRLERFVVVAEELQALHARGTTARRPPERVRDEITIPAIVDLLDRISGQASPPEDDWEYVDMQCAFVAHALGCAGIACPAAGDTEKSGEEEQGRLRRLLKDRNRARREALSEAGRREGPGKDKDH